MLILVPPTGRDPSDVIDCCTDISQVDSLSARVQQNKSESVEEYVRQFTLEKKFVWPPQKRRLPQGGDTLRTLGADVVGLEGVANGIQNHRNLKSIFSVLV
ncbi:MAG: hypothetical protein ACREE2_06810 [Stellaceae bacterium]